jgi:diguanylate cyclase (GGDEF)-like protein
MEGAAISRLARPNWLRYRDGRPIPGAVIAWLILTSAVLLPLAGLVLARSDWAAEPNSRFAALALAAIIASLFSIRGGEGAWFVLTPAVCAGGVILLPAGGALAVAAAASTSDWIRRRYLPGNSGTLSGLTALQNGLNYLGAILAAEGMQLALGSSQQNAIRGLMPAAVVLSFVTTTELGFAVLGRLGWGRSFSDSLRTENLLPELALASTGAAAALLWQRNVWYLLLPVAPIALTRLAQRVPHLEVVASQDAKTGLLNSATFNAELEDELARAIRRELPLTVVAADLDHLRDINNNHGHLAGDVMIQGFAETLTTHLRRGDIAGRFGGEEFLAVLPATDGAEGERVAERIRSAFAAQIFRADGGVTFRGTVSIGIASYPESGESVYPLLKAADVALYEAKAAGRNCVIRRGFGPRSTREGTALAG